MDEFTIEAAEQISLFCRLMLNQKRELSIRSGEMGLLILADKKRTPITPLMAAQYFRVSKPMIAAVVRSPKQKGLLAKPGRQRTSFYSQAHPGRARSGGPHL